MNRYFIEIAFRGTHFHGWQIQPNAFSIQKAMEEALSMLLKETIRVTGAGRTDTGVHASYFVAHFDSSEILNTEQLAGKLNILLEKDISVFKIRPMPTGAHARFDALSRCYKYIIIRYKHPFLKDLGYYYHGILNIEAMNQASAILKETRDFTSFAKLHSDNKTNICKISRSDWVEKEGFLIYTIRGDRFLRNMVRSVTGTLLDVGKGKINLEEFKQIIESRDNQKASASAPAKGLYLSDISYPASWSMHNPAKNKLIPFIW